MKIVALSACPMSPAQRARLGALGELEYHDALLGEAAQLEHVRGAEILVSTPRVPGDLTPYLDSLRMISVQATGVDAFPLEAVRARGIRLTNVPGGVADAVAEHAFALLLAAAKRLPEGPGMLQSRAWTRALAYVTTGLRGKTLGLFGFGGIAQRIVAPAEAFGMRVIATVRDPSRPRPVGTVDFATLLAESDALVLAAPATAETTDLFDSAAFARMRPGAILVNVARGALVVEEAALAALDSGALAAYATDVFRQEPPAPDAPLLRHPKVLVSPHVAWGTTEAIERMLDTAIENVEAYLAGRPRNVVV